MKTTSLGSKTFTAEARTETSERVKTWAWHILALLFFTYLFGASMNFNLNDPDVWWQIKSGQYISQHRSLIKEDPFSYTTPRHLAPDQQEGMASAWLAQVIFYSASKAGGLFGVGVLRGFLITLPMLMIYLWLVERRCKPWLAISAVSITAFLLVFELFYSFERPQGISFLFSVILIILLEDLRNGRKRTLIFLPVFMALWSNIHGGFIVGNVIIMLYLFGEALTWGIKKLRKKAAELNLVFFGGSLAGILASGLNPNGFKLFYNYLTGLLSMFTSDVVGALTRRGGAGWVSDVVLEYKPLAYFYRDLGYTWIMFFWVFTALLIILLMLKYWLKRKFDFTEIFTVSFVSFFANYYARGLMFGLVILSFYFGKSLWELSAAQGRRLSLKTTRLVPTVFALSAYALLALFLVQNWRPLSWAMKPGITKQWVTPWYPESASEFILAEHIKPPMYNFYTWGGFLIWRLFPEYKVFIDGRALDENVNRVADGILKTFPDWDRELDAYGINFIVIPVVFRESGYVIPLAPALIQKKEWKLVFIGNNSTVFVRDVPENKGIIDKYNKDKMDVYREIVNTENILLYMSPNNPIYNVSKADALFALGYIDQAKELYNRFPQFTNGRFRQ